MSIVNLEGAIDMHCHSGPSIYERKGDVLEISIRAAQAGMGGIVFKSHHIDTSDRCYLVNKIIPEKFDPEDMVNFKAFSSIALNDYQGGLNPVAVKQCLESGGKVIFMPVIHAAYHAKVYGSGGSYKIDSMSTEGKSSEITILDKEGELTDTTKEIVLLVKKFDAVIATSHLSPIEQEKLISYARDQKVDIIVTHAYYTRDCDLDFYVRMAEMGAYIELCACLAFPMSVSWDEDHTLQQAMELFDAVGIDKCIISSDAGQPFNPWPHDAIQLYAQMLHEYGITEDDLRIMIVENPKKLLRI